jgi:hypothetical protein
MDLQSTAVITDISTPVTLQPRIDSTTFLRVLDADGGTEVAYVDTTNERLGMQTLSFTEHAALPAATPGLCARLTADDRLYYAK